MNAKRVASLCRQIGSLFIELADAVQEEAAVKPARKRPVPPPEVQPSAGTVDRVRRALRRQGVRT